MLRLQSYKFRLKTNNNHDRQLRQFAGNCRFVWNKALALQKDLHASGAKRLSYAGLCKALTGWRKDPYTPWLAESPIHPLQQTLKDLERAYRNFFAGRADFPQFKKKGRNESFRHPDGFKIDEPNGRIFLPKFGFICYHRSRHIEGTPKNVTLSLSAGHWYMSVQTEREGGDPVHPSTSAVGIDMGVVKLAALSDGNDVKSLHIRKKYETLLARHQRSLSRKKKGSNNRKKAKAKLLKVHTKIANTRKDHLHKVSTTICKSHAIVCMEDLRVANMSGSAKGTRENPGRNVRAKAGLNNAILDQGWSEFRRQIEYKQSWMGGIVIIVSPQNTSRRCSSCGHVAADNRKTQSRFRCVNCGLEMNADTNAARNILAAGLAVTACGEAAQQGSSMKQEPAWAVKACA